MEKEIIFSLIGVKVALTAAVAVSTLLSKAEINALKWAKLQ